MTWLERVRYSVINRFDTTVPEGSRESAIELRMMAKSETHGSNRYWALVELARAFDSYWIYLMTQDQQWKRMCCTHYDNATDWAKEAT